MTETLTIRPDIHNPEDVFGAYNDCLPDQDREYYATAVSDEFTAKDAVEAVEDAFKIAKNLALIRQKQAEVRGQATDIEKTLGATALTDEHVDEVEEPVSLLDLVDQISIRYVDILPAGFTESLAERLLNASTPEAAIEVGAEAIISIPESDQYKHLVEANETVRQDAAAIKALLEPDQQIEPEKPILGVKARIAELIKRRDTREYQENNFNFINLQADEEMQKDDKTYFALSIKETLRKYKNQSERYLQVKYNRDYSAQSLTEEVRLAGLIVPDKWIGKGYGAKILDIWVDFVEKKGWQFGLTSRISKPQIANQLFKYGDRDESKVKFEAQKNNNGPDYTIRILPVEYWSEDKKGHKIPKIIYTNPGGGPKHDKYSKADGHILYEVADLTAYSPEEQKTIIESLRTRPDIPFHRQWKVKQKNQTKQAS